MLDARFELSLMTVLQDANSPIHTSAGSGPLTPSQPRAHGGLDARAPRLCDTRLVLEAVAPLAPQVIFDPPRGTAVLWPCTLLQ